MTHTDMIAKVCNAAPVIPVLTIDRVEDAQPLARALVAGGLPALEITLRTAAAMEAIAAVAEVEGAMAGVGTLLTAAHIRDAKSAGATFGVSPGATETLIQAAQDYDLPLLPGAATATEAMRLLEQGFVFQKFFPAEAAGGAPALGSMAGPLPQITFLPHGWRDTRKCENLSRSAQYPLCRWQLDCAKGADRRGRLGSNHTDRPSRR